MTTFDFDPKKKKRYPFKILLANCKNNATILKYLEIGIIMSFILSFICCMCILALPDYHIELKWSCSSFLVLMGFGIPVHNFLNDGE